MRAANTHKELIRRTAQTRADSAKKTASRPPKSPKAIASEALEAIMKKVRSKK